jgi:hypothetical protein
MNYIYKIQAVFYWKFLFPAVNTFAVANMI